MSSAATSSQPTTNLRPVEHDRIDSVELDNQRLRLELVELQGQLRQSKAEVAAAADEARRRLERDLHDGAQQQLISAAIRLKGLQSMIASDPARAASLAESSVSDLLEVSAEIRRLVTGAGPGLLDRSGLAQAIRSVADRSPLDVELTDLPERRFPQPAEADVYFIVSELLTNVIKHAGASKVVVGVVEVDRSILIEVTDDGCGGADASRGSGLAGLRGRADSLDVLSVVGGGTKVRATVGLGAADGLILSH